MLTHLRHAGGNTTLCCNTTPDRLPIGDLLDEDPALTTCAGPVLDVPDTVNAKRFPPKPFVLETCMPLARHGSAMTEHARGGRPPSSRWRNSTPFARTAASRSAGMQPEPTGTTGTTPAPLAIPGGDRGSGPHARSGE